MIENVDSSVIEIIAGLPDKFGKVFSHNEDPLEQDEQSKRKKKRK